jgi:hypothetical protein
MVQCARNQKGNATRKRWSNRSSALHLMYVIRKENIKIVRNAQATGGIACPISRTIENRSSCIFCIAHSTDHHLDLPQLELSGSNVTLASLAARPASVQCWRDPSHPTRIHHLNSESHSVRQQPLLIWVPHRAATSRLRSCFQAAPQEPPPLLLSGRGANGFSPAAFRYRCTPQASLVSSSRLNQHQPLPYDRSVASPFQNVNLRTRHLLL